MNFIFKELRITNIKEKKSKTIKFNSYNNVITSNKNSVGKSIIMKSLYHTLGADADFDKKFPLTDFLFELEFSYGKNNYKFTRLLDNIAIYKEEADLFDYKLEVVSNKGKRTNVSKYFEREFGLAVYLKKLN